MDYKDAEKFRKILERVRDEATAYFEREMRRADVAEKLAAQEKARADKATALLSAKDKAKDKHHPGASVRAFVPEAERKLAGDINRVGQTAKTGEDMAEGYARSAIAYAIGKVLGLALVPMAAAVIQPKTQQTDIAPAVDFDVMQDPSESGPEYIALPQKDALSALGGDALIPEPPPLVDVFATGPGRAALPPGRGRRLLPGQK
jgi:hypothetical protein